MDNLKTDRDLLREYADHGSEPAFQALVERHVDLVFATVLRSLNEPGAAQEVVQNVFIALARKAVLLRGQTSLAGWLHKTALFEARLWWRGELRRQRREHTAATLGTTMKDDESLLKSLTGLLDEGLMSLRDADRQALMLRYFEGRSHRDIGNLLGAREDAVRMRIDKALGRLTDFFRQRGYSVPAVATTVAALTAAAKAAPAGLAILATQSAVAAGSAGATGGLLLILAKIMQITKTQTAALCLVVAAAPIGWEWQAVKSLRSQSAALQSELTTTGNRLEQSSREVALLREESSRLDLALSDAAKTQSRHAAAERKLEDLKTRIRGLLTDPHYQWPEDLPFIRIPKAAVKAIDLINHSPTFNRNGELTEQALELFSVTTQEKAPTEQALANYWRGVKDMMVSNAYVTNIVSSQPNRKSITVIVPALGQPMKEMAAATRAQLVDILGAEREKLIFGGWDEGGIQDFWPGNISNIAETPQSFTLWVDTTSTNEPRYGSSWHCGGSGQSREGNNAMAVLTGSIADKFFVPWLQQLGLAPATSTTEAGHE